MKQLSLLLFIFLIIFKINSQAYKIADEIHLGDFRTDVLAEVIELDDESILLVGFTKQQSEVNLIITKIDQDYNVIDTKEHNLELTRPILDNCSAILTKNNELLIGFSEKLIRLNSDFSIDFVKSYSNLIISIEELVENAMGYVLVGEFYDNGNWDGSVVQLDIDGNVIWNNNIKGPGDDFITSVIVDADGNIVVIGDESLNSGLRLISFTNSGTLHLDKTFDIEGYIYSTPKSLVQSNDGNYFVAGRIKSGSSDLITRVGSLSKISPDGELLWTKTYTTASDDYISKIYEQSDGNFLLLGTGNSVSALEPNSQFWIVLADENGEELSQQLFDSQSSYCLSTELLFNSKRNLALFGYSWLDPNELDYTILCLENELSSSYDKFAKCKLTPYPNPASYKVTIDPEFHNFISADIYNLSGRKISTQKIVENKLSVSDLKDGLYFVTLKANHDNLIESSFRLAVKK